MRTVLASLILTIVALGVVEMSDNSKWQLNGFTPQDEILESAIAKLVISLPGAQQMEATRLRKTFSKINEILGESKSRDTECLMEKASVINRSQESVSNGSPAEKAQMKEALELLMSLPVAAQSCSIQSEEVIAKLYLALNAKFSVRGSSMRIYVDYAREWGKLCIKMREQVQLPTRFDEWGDEALWNALRNELYSLSKEQNRQALELSKPLAKINHHLDQAESTDIEILMKMIREIEESLCESTENEAEMADVKKATGLMVSLPVLAKSCDSNSLETLAILYKPLMLNVYDGHMSRRIYVHYTRQWAKLCLALSENKTSTSALVMILATSRCT